MPYSLLLSLALLSATAAFATDVYLPVMPAIAAEFGVADAWVQLTLTAFFVGLAAGQLFIGPLSDALGRKTLLLLGAVGAVAASVLAALAPNIGVLIAARFLHGLGGGACVVLSRAVVPDLLVGKAAARAFSLLMAIQAIAPALAPIIGGLLAEPIGWRGIYWVLVGLHVVQLLLAWLVVPETGGRNRQGRLLGQVLGNYATVLSHPAILGYLGSMSFGFSAMFCYISASPFVIQDVLGFSPAGYSLVFAVNSLGLLAANLVNMRLVDSHGPKVMLRAGVILSVCANAVLLATIAFGAGGGVVLVALFFCVAPTGFIMGNSAALATGLRRDKAGSVSAVMGGVQSLLGGLVSPLMGLGSDRLLTMSLGMCVCAGVAVAAAFAATRWHVGE
ncbi:multidrug effflux MFS transporter [Corynebacterium sp. 32222D000AT]|uniref:multidrug effflux MFS transporter n=2 Tax=unclassified Corynebacterium TaxID=2624378 RepID=UPI002A96707C|nr:multidrug effflux MFS transporter [Mycobacteriaceae bacterium]MDY5829863.1 multidrug effflux MFS transporter [Corynebacterium sp.]